MINMESQFLFRDQEGEMLQNCGRCHVPGTGLLNAAPACYPTPDSDNKLVLPRRRGKLCCAAPGPEVTAGQWCQLYCVKADESVLRPLRE